MNQWDIMSQEIAVIIEQYTDHTEVRLPGLGPDWRVVGSTPEAALGQLMGRIRNQSPPTTSDAAPIAVSLLALDPLSPDLSPPTVIYAPHEVVALFYGDLNPVQAPPSEAIWLKPGQHIPEDSPDGSMFVMPHRTVPFHPDHVVIRSHQGPYRLLHHAAGSVQLVPAAHAVSEISRPAQAPEPLCRHRHGFGKV